MSEFKPYVYDVTSNSDPSKVYHVTNYRPNRYSCTCKDYLYRSHDKNGFSLNHKCKHIKEIIDKLGVQGMCDHLTLIYDGDTDKTRCVDCGKVVK